MTDTATDSQPGSGLTEPQGGRVATGMAVGRYLVGARLGAGGMGVVYLARDRLLDRQVALKVLKGDAAGEPGRAGQERLFEEARKLARLQDPHIVAVYDVGTFVDQVYFAMEYMPGSLRALLAAPPAGPAERTRRLQLLLAAGRGLAAAHRAGIVHRDFKPDNVLLDAEGRARVSDFGLALPVGAGAAREGTPGYQAPGKSPGLASPTADQYAFCASVWEALTGALPGQGDGAALPPHLRRVLQRGLGEQPYPSMEALLAALEADPARTWRRRLLAAAAGLTVLVSLGVAGAAVSRETPREALARQCRERVQGARTRLWSTERQAAVGAAFAAQGPSGALTLDRVRERLGGEVEAWVQLASAACAQPEDAPGRRQLEACLQARQLTLGTLTQLFATADAQVVANAVNTVSLALMPVGLCVPREAGAASAPPPDRSLDLRARLARAQVQWAAGQYRAAREAAEAVGDDAQRLGDWHLLAEARLLEGRAVGRLRDADAEDVLKRAITDADRAQADEERAQGWVALASWLGARGRAVEARLALLNAESVVDRLGRPPLLEADLLTAHGRLEQERTGGDLAAARLGFERALQLRKSALPPAHPLVINALANWATALPAAQRLRWQLEVLDQRTTAYGPSHPETASAEQNLGSTYLELADCPQAQGFLARARATQAQDPRRDPLGLGRVYGALARYSLDCQRDPAQAWREAQRALDALHQGDAADPELRQELSLALELRALAGRPAAEGRRLQEELDDLDEEAGRCRPGLPRGP